MTYNYEDYIRSVDNFPSPGITFYDIAPLVGEGAVFSALIADVADATDPEVTKIVGFDARGFVFGSALALRLGVGFVMLRKPGKLPGDTFSTAYDLEYGSAGLELQTDVLTENDTVLLVDDVIATGGTALAGIDLVRRSKASIAGFMGVIDLPDLRGSKKITAAGVLVHTVMSFGGPQ